MDFEKLINKTQRLEGHAGENLNRQWQELCQKMIPKTPPVRTIKWEGHEIKINKPLLFIRSDDYHYTFGNLEKIPALKENFILSVFQKPKKGEVAIAEQMAEKFRAIPALRTDNIRCVIRVPDDASKDEIMQWKTAANDLGNIIGSENVLFDPNKEEFSAFFENKQKDVVVLEITHTKNGIPLRGNESFNYKDVEKMPDLHHIKYLMSGQGCCRLAEVNNGKLLEAFKKMGIGVMNISNTDVTINEGLKRLRVILKIIGKAPFYNIHSYRIPDIINQILKLEDTGAGIINCVEKEFKRNSFSG